LEAGLGAAGAAGAFSRARRLAGFGAGFRGFLAASFGMLET
jgi:hypothetical protein